MACDLVLSAQGAVSALCIDQVNGCIVAGVQEIIRWEESPYYEAYNVFSDQRETNVANQNI